jgi:DamX protein
VPSELHDRLDYLVNYSSQLIFVSGDSIAEQQRTLEAFVYQQKDNTELAFLNANASMEISDYRRELCRQLLGQIVGSYIRPLNELLAQLNLHEGPVLITITQAEHIPDQLLQELWELVLQSRFASNKQHLNVLLFGESSWAEQAKQWLPAKNTNTPLLISSQSVSRDEFSGDIDKLLKQRRAAFDKHLADRHAESYPSTINRLRSPWLWFTGCILFISCFALIMSLQYQDSLSSLFSPINDKGELSQGARAQITLPQKQKSTITAQIIPPEDIPAAPVVSESQNVTSDLADNRRVASSFADALAQTQITTDATAAPVTETLVPEDSSSEVSTLTPPEPVQAQITTEVDTVETPKTRVDEDKATLLPPKADAEMQLANETLLTLTKDNNYWVQLASLKDVQLLKNYLKDNDLLDTTLVYKTQRFGGDWYVVLWRHPLATLQEARDMLAALPNIEGRAEAFIKRGRQIQQELNQP